MVIQPPSILIIDDETGAHERIRDVFSREGYCVEEANSAETGWNLIQSGNFSLVLLDIAISGTDNIALLKRIVAFDPNLPCIVITGPAIGSATIAAIEEGAYDFIAKPIEPVTLLLTVHRAVEYRQLRMETSRLAVIEKEKDTLERRQAKLEQLDHARSAYTITVAHELRAPVAAIQSYLRLILDGYVPPDKQQEYLKRAERRAGSLLELVDDLLDLAHLRDPDLSVNQEPVDVAKELRETCQLMAGQAQEKNLQFHISIPDNPVFIQANPRHIRQVWPNLISNAIKYTQQGSITVTMVAKGDAVVTSVRDTGIGISQSDLERIFEDFYRTKAAKAGPQTGAGLGLSLVKRIVDAYGGQIDVQSAVGKGSQFTVTLPLQHLAQSKVEDKTP